MFYDNSNSSIIDKKKFVLIFVTYDINEPRHLHHHEKFTTNACSKLKIHHNLAGNDKSISGKC